MAKLQIEKKKDARNLVEALVLGDLPYEILHSNSDRLIARVRDNNATSFIVKLWKRPGVRGIYRRLTKTGSLDREWRVLHHLHRREIPVPKPLHRLHFKRSINGFTDALVMQDLGNYPRGTYLLIELIEKNRSEEIAQFEEQLIKLTKAILGAGVLDRDHQIMNILAVSPRKLIRIDFELASIVSFPRLHKRLFSRMISRLIITYCHAARPNKECIDKFITRLASELKLSRSESATINSMINEKSEYKMYSGPII